MLSIVQRQKGSVSKMLSSAFRLTLVATVVALTGCAATVNRGDTQSSTQGAIKPATAATEKVAVLITGSPTVESSKDWQDFRGEWRGAMAAAAAASKLNFGYFDSEIPPQSAGTTLVKIKVNDYRYLSTGARIGFGIFTGNAFVDSDVEFIEQPGGRSLGTRKYSTTSSAWQGVFSAMTDKQLQALSTEIVKDVTQR
jgi:hypothetical protein